MGSDPYRTVLVPIVNEEDADVTATAVRERFDDATVIVTYVVEKAGGAPDSAGVEQREAFARGLFERFERRWGEGEGTVRSHLAYGTDVAETILEVAADEGVDAIVFVPRGDRRWKQLVSGDVARKLLNRTDRPILILPKRTDG